MLGGIDYPDAGRTSAAQEYRNGGAPSRGHLRARDHRDRQEGSRARDRGPRHRRPSRSRQDARDPPARSNETRPLGGRGLLVAVALAASLLDAAPPAAKMPPPPRPTGNSDPRSAVVRLTDAMGGQRTWDVLLPPIRLRRGPRGQGSRPLPGTVGQAPGAMPCRGPRRQGTDRHRGLHPEGQEGSPSPTGSSTRTRRTSRASSRWATSGG